LIVKNKGVKS